MRKPPHKAERWRLDVPAIPDSGRGTNDGIFRIPYAKSQIVLGIKSSDGLGWDHVSVSLPNRCPAWEEMDFIKGIFWNDGEAVFQFHPPRALWVNVHPFCLHLWKPQKTQIELPMRALV